MLALEHKRSSSRAPASTRTGPQRGTLTPCAGPVLQRARSCACGGGCPRCATSSNLEVGSPDDDFEREADATAERVMRMVSGAAAVRSAPPALQRKCAACEEEGQESFLQLKKTSAGARAPGTVSTAPASVRAVVNSPGQPLPADTRAFFEQRFGWDFSTVRVHADSHAHQSAREVNARAFTVGDDIVFGAAQFSPGTDDGQHLLAHELTHVVQQSGRAQRLQRQGTRTPACPTRVTVSSGARPVHVPSCGPTPVTASRRPASAPVTWSLANGSTQPGFPGAATTVAAATSISNAAGSSGTITVSPSQTPGFIVVTATGPTGCFASAPLNFASTPVGVGLTRVIGPLTTSATRYGARFENTLDAASGNPAHLLQVKVNERFSGLATPNAATHLVPTPFGNFTLHSNPWSPNSDAPGWAVTASGVQGPDNIGIERRFIDVGRFVSSASNPTPATTLTMATPVGFSVQQDLHWFCAQAAAGSQWVTPPFARLTHTRHLMEVSGNLSFVTGIPAPSLAATSDPYTGQPAIIRAAATPNPVTVSATVPPGSPRGTRPPPRNTTTVTADTLPSSLAGLSGRHGLRFSIRGNPLGCSISATTGVVRVGTRPGTITVRVRDVNPTNRNFDEVPVTISTTPSAPPPTTPSPQSPHPGLHLPSTPGQIAPPPPLPVIP